MQMTSRERLTRLFEGRDIDRTPIWLLFPWHRLNCYADVYNIDVYKPIIRRIEAGDVDSFDRRGVKPGFCYNANPDIVMHNTSPNETIVTAPGLELRKALTKTDGITRVKFFVDEPEQLKDILAVPYVAPKPPLEILRKEKEEFGDRGLFMLDIGDPLGPLYNLMSVTDFAMATATDYDLLLEFVDEMERRCLELYRYFLEADVADCFFIVGTEFAGPPLVSPAKFEEMSVRYVKKICDLIRSYGKKSIVHYHGNLYDIRNGMKTIGPDALHTIEAPPIGNCTLTQAREVLGKMILIGNVQYDDMIRLPKEEIEQQVKMAMAETDGKHFILSPTAGPYEPTLDQHAIKNYLAFIDAGLKYGRQN